MVSYKKMCHKFNWIKNPYFILFLIIVLSLVITTINHSLKYEFSRDEGSNLFNSYLLASGMKTYTFFYFLHKTPGMIWLQYPIIKIFGNTFLAVFMLRFISNIVIIL